MGINKRLHEVEVALGFAEKNEVVEEDQDDFGDVFNHTLYGIHITKQNNALSTDNPHICIGWSSLGDLSTVSTKEELSMKYDEVYQDKTKRGKAQDVGQLWRFIHEAKIGDYVILGESSKLHIGRIESNYYYDSTENPNQDSDYVNHRKVKWLKTNIDRTILSSSFHYSLGSAMSFFTLNDYKAAVVDLLNGTYKKDDDVVEVKEDNFTKDIIDYDTCDRIYGGKNIILYGVPGAGKSWTIKNEYCNDDGRMERIVFHPDYTYSDFVGQILPKLGDDGSVSYEFTPGPFTKLLKKAYKNPNEMFFLVIEEVNRGNAPAIFGDIFQLLDRNKDGKSEYYITNSDIAKVVYNNENHKVYIPSNMSILCTMNTSDQNVFTLDTAFQRRWSMRLIKNKFSGEQELEFAMTKILDTDITWNKFFTEINKIILSKNIRMTSSEDKRLGTHFVSIEDLKFIKGDEKQNSRFSEKVLKYLWDDAFKFTKEDIFDLDKVKSLEEVIEYFTSNNGNDRLKVFKDNIYNTLTQ